MPLSDIQAAILRRLAASRNPESYVAGATPLHRDGPRLSDDIDIFHDREEAVAIAAAADANLLESHGFTIRWLRREPGLHVVQAGLGLDVTRLEWARDSDFRFFPTQADPLFGWRLHVADLATNKALAAAGRREPRDLLDLIFIDQRHLPLAAVLWAAVGKDEGYSPESLLDEIRRNARYRADDFSGLTIIDGMDAGAALRRFRAALDTAEEAMRGLPPGSEGCLFLAQGVPVLPDNAGSASVTRHEGRRRGHWPSSSEIGGAMLDTGG